MNYRVVLVLSCLLLAVTTARADTVVFTHGTELECKVLGLEPEGWRVILGNDEKASVVLDAATVDHVDYDYDSRLDAIHELEQVAGKPFPRKHYELGLWCEENASYDSMMHDRARNRFLHVR